MKTTLLLLLVGLVSIAVAQDDYNLEDFSIVTMTYKEAAEYCEDKGKRLLYPANKTQMIEMLIDLQDKGLYKAWIGVDRLATMGDNKPYRWQVHRRKDIVVADDLWGLNQPDNENGNNRCVMVNWEVMAVEGEAWDDRECDEAYNFYCVDVYK